MARAETLRPTFTDGKAAPAIAELVKISENTGKTEYFSRMKTLPLLHDRTKGESGARGK